MSASEYDTCYSASDNSHKSRKVFAATHLQIILIDLEEFCSTWRIKLNPEKTCCINFHITKENNNTPRLWLKGNLLQYKKSCKFLGITVDQHDFDHHLNDIVNKT